MAPVYIVHMVRFTELLHLIDKIHFKNFIQLEQRILPWHLPVVQTPMKEQIRRYFDVSQ